MDGLAHSGLRVAAAIAAGAAVLALVRKARGRRHPDLWRQDLYPPLLRATIAADARDLFNEWLTAARAALAFLDANAVVLATASEADGATARTVFLQDVDAAGNFRLGTNSESQKARHLRSDDRCELLFRWGWRQVRVRGRGRIVGPGDITDASYAGLPVAAQASLRLMSQGAPLDEDSHASTIARTATFLEDDASYSPSFGAPANYSAVAITPELFEFFQGGDPSYGYAASDRFLYRRAADGTFPLLTRLQA